MGYGSNLTVKDVQIGKLHLGFMGLIPSYILRQPHLTKNKMVFLAIFYKKNDIIVNLKAGFMFFLGVSMA